MSYARRVDANHGAIRTAFRKLLGKENVKDTSRCGDGIGDLLVTYGGLLMAIEIKTETGKLTDAQKACKLPNKVVRNMDDVAGAVATLKGWSECLRLNLRG